MRHASRLRRTTGTAAVAMAVLAAASLLLDARMATRALSLTAEAVTWGTFVSAIGSSAWMFVAVVLALSGLWVKRWWVAKPQAGHTLNLAIERVQFLLATLCTETLAVQTVKHLVGRARPSGFRAFGPYHFDVLSLTDDLASFPSGHSCTAFAMATALSLLYPRFRVAAFTMAGGVALSRIVVQAHYVSDILAGSALGCVTAVLTAQFLARRGIAFVQTPGGGLKLREGSTLGKLSVEAAPCA